VTDGIPSVAVILKVADIAETLRWYQLVGFEVCGTAPDDDPTWAEVTRDGLVVQFLAGDTPWDGPPRMTGCLYVHPPSVEQLYENIRDSVRCEQGIETRPWGAVELTLQDPNGYFVTFTEDAT
jgi:hypothetical protein